jgi:hypothetical protein
MKKRRVNIDFPIPFLAQIDAEADRDADASPRQTWIKFVLSQYLPKFKVVERSPESSAR